MTPLGKLLNQAKESQFVGSVSHQKTIIHFSLVLPLSLPYYKSSSYICTVLVSNPRGIPKKRKEMRTLTIMDNVTLLMGVVFNSIFGFHIDVHFITHHFYK